MQHLASVTSAVSVFDGPALDDINESDDDCENSGGKSFLPSQLSDGPSRKAPSRESSLGGTDAFAQMFAQYDKIVDSVASLMTTGTNEDLFAANEFSDEDDDEDDNELGAEAHNEPKYRGATRRSSRDGPIRGISRKSSRDNPITRGIARHASRDGPLMRQVARSRSGDMEEQIPVRPIRRPGLGENNSRAASCSVIGGQDDMTATARPNEKQQRRASTNHLMMQRQESFKMNDFFKAYEDEITLTTGW